MGKEVGGGREGRDREKKGKKGIRKKKKLIGC